jgi:hypothetical protein
MERLIHLRLQFEGLIEGLMGAGAGGLWSAADHIRARSAPGVCAEYLNPDIVPVANPSGWPLIENWSAP